MSVACASSGELAQLYALLQNRTQNKTVHLEAIQSGEERAYVCKYCHGEDGNSKREHIPNLAQQNSKYLLSQFELFASYARKNKIMSELAKSLSAEDRVNIALYYSSQKVKTRAKDKLKTKLNAYGKQLFIKNCSQCHGDKGLGHDELPMIANQPAEYILRTLSKYKSSKSFRPESAMQPIAKKLSSKEINALSSYLSTMD